MSSAALVTFALLISDMTEGVNSYMMIIANDVKLLKKKVQKDREALQQDLGKISGTEPKKGNGVSIQQL